jgi:mannose-6-phosphate isomerase-like protein (cupin superfamily)
MFTTLKRQRNRTAEVHKLDQFFRVEEGEGKAVLDGVEHRLKPGFAVLVPAGTRHNIINGPSGPMKLYTLHAPLNHRDGVVHATKADAEPVSVGIFPVKRENTGKLSQIWPQNAIGLSFSHA